MPHKGGREPYSFIIVKKVSPAQPLPLSVPQPFTWHPFSPGLSCSVDQDQQSTKRWINWRRGLVRLYRMGFIHHSISDGELDTHRFPAKGFKERIANPPFMDLT